MLSKFKKIISVIRYLIKEPSLINKILEDDNANKISCDKEFPQFKNGLPEISFEKFLASNCEVRIYPYTFLDGGSLLTDLALLKLVCEKVKANTYFEIGTWRGESAVCVAEHVQQCYTLNLSNEEMQKNGWSKDYIQLHGHYSKNTPNITHLFGDSSKFDFSPFLKKIDVIFVDGDHRLDAVIQDSKTATELLRNKDSVIIWHDYKSSPETIRWEVLRGILHGTNKEMHGSLFGVQNTLCAIYFPKEIQSHPLKYPSSPQHEFDITLKLKKD